MVHKGGNKVAKKESLMERREEEEPENAAAEANDQEEGGGRIDDEGSVGLPHFWTIKEGLIVLKKEVCWEELQ